MKNISALLVLALAGACASRAESATDTKPAEAMPATAPRINSDTCIFFRTVYDWRALDSRHLVLWAPGSNDAYLVETMMPLQDLLFADSLAFVDGNRDGQLCSYGMDEIIVPHSSIPEHASITSLKKLDEAGLAQLSRQYHVKLDRRKKADKAGAPASAPVPTPQSADPPGQPPSQQPTAGKSS